MFTYKVINTKDYKSHRWFYTASGMLVIGGKNESQNELVLKNFLKPNYIVVHTSAPGSPFMIIQSDSPNNQDIVEAGIFCACFSKQWKNLKNQNEKISIDIFKGNQIYKARKMKIGSFVIKGKIKKVVVKPELVLVIQSENLRAVPKVKRKEKILAKITSGKLSKEKAVEKICEIIKNQFNITKEEIMQAIPSDKLSINKK